MYTLKLKTQVLSGTDSLLIVIPRSKEKQKYIVVHFMQLSAIKWQGTDQQSSYMWW